LRALNLSVKSKMSWSETFPKLLKDNDVRLITYVPDNVLTPLIAGVSADNYFLPVTATREDEAIGTVRGAYMAGLRGAVMMQPFHERAWHRPRRRVGSVANSVFADPACGSSSACRHL
jgi:hypothetical protein